MSRLSAYRTIKDHQADIAEIVEVTKFVLTTSSIDASQFRVLKMPNFERFCFKIC